MGRSLDKDPPQHHRQTLRMLGVMRENAAKRKLFESLAEAGLTAASAATIEAIVDIFLDQLGTVLRGGRGFGIVVRDRSRVRLQYCAAFRGLLRLDHVFVSNEIGVRGVKVPYDARSRRASDHLPLIVDLELRE